MKLTRWQSARTMATRATTATTATITALALVAAMALLCPADARAAEPQSGASAQAQARAALDRGELDGARPGLAAAAAEALFELALAERGEARAADLARAGALAPEGHWLRPATAGLILLDTEKAAEATAKLREAVAARSTDKRLHKLLGDALRAQDDSAGAHGGLQRGGRARSRVRRGAPRGGRSQARGGRLRRRLQRLQPCPRRSGPAGGGARRACRRPALHGRQGWRLRRPEPGGRGLGARHRALSGADGDRLRPHLSASAAARARPGRTGAGDVAGSRTPRHGGRGLQRGRPRPARDRQPRAGARVVRPRLADRSGLDDETRGAGHLAGPSTARRFPRGRAAPGGPQGPDARRRGQDPHGLGRREPRALQLDLPLPAGLPALSGQALRGGDRAADEVGDRSPLHPVSDRRLARPACESARTPGSGTRRRSPALPGSTPSR